MSKERELLQRCLDEFEYKGVACNELCIDINKLLAEPETAQEPIACVAHSSVGFDVSHSVQGMPLLWLGKLEYGDKLYRVRVRDE